MISIDEAKKTEDMVRNAGAILLSARPDESAIHEKEGPANFVTDYDVRIQEYLIGGLSDVFPDAAFFGEEDTKGSTKTVGKGYTFFIDPVDGTTNLMFDYHNSCVSVGLAMDGKMIAGWVYNPYTDEMFTAIKGRGAKKNGQKLAIENRSMSEGIVAYGCARYNEGDRIFKILEELFMRSLSIRNGGSAAIDLCRIAAGSNVGYVEMKLQPYDYAAASVIIEEAGGCIMQPDGKSITLDGPCPIVAGTPEAVRQIIGLLEENK